MAKLVCQAGPNAGHEYSLNKDKTLFGRQKTCDVQVLDSMASREQFLVRRDGNLFSLVDLESRNGTYLNDRKISERQLEFGDRVRVGKVEYLFVKEEGDLEIKDLLTRKYEILEKIGEGGMGIVYKAVQKSMDRVVALKILSPKYASRQRFVEQFIREARAAGALNHANIIQVHDVGSENDIHYFSMEYVDGVTCMDMIKTQGQLPVEAALEILRQTAKALDYAHEKHLIHRDIKPDNIMVGSGNTVKLADLGISKTFEEAEAEGAPKRIVGTPHYMAPEAALGRPIDSRVDIYSLGATCYHMLAGRTPFSGGTATDILKGHIKEPLVPLDEYDPEAPEDVTALIGEMMAKDPAERIGSANEVMERVQHLQKSLLSRGYSSTEPDTVMLQRLAQNSRETLRIRRSGREELPEETVGDRDDDGEDWEDGGGTPGEATATFGTGGTAAGASPQDLAIIRYSLVAMIVILLGVIGVEVYHGVLKHLAETPEDGGEAIAGTDGGDGGNQGEGRAEDEGPESGGGNGDDDQGNGTAVDYDRKRRVDTALDAIEKRIRSETGAALTALADELDALQADAVTEAQRRRIVLLRRVVDQRLENELQATRREAFADLKSEIGKLRDAHDYPSAIERLEAAKAEADLETVERLDDLIEQVEKDRDSFLGSLEAQIKRDHAAKDLAALKRQLQELPEPLLNHEIAKELESAIKEVDRELHGRQSELLAEAEQLAGELRFTEFDTWVRLNRDDLTDRGIIDELAAIEEDVAAAGSAIASLDEAIAVAEHGKVRFDGNLRGFREPDITGADREAVELQIAGGGRSRVIWREVSAEDVRGIFAAVYGDEGPDKAISLLALRDLASDDAE